MPLGQNCTSKCETRDHEVDARCNKCGRDLPECAFYKYKTGPQAGKLMRPCRECAIAGRVAWVRANPEKHRESMRRQRAKDPRRAWDISLRANHGITADEYDALLLEQGGGCAICGSQVPGGKGRFHIDHDHSCCPRRKSCGQCVRGLLCSTCNTGLGHLKDSADLLRKAIAYVTR